MFNYVFYLNKQYKWGSFGLDEYNGKLVEGVKTLKSCGEILISHPKWWKLVIRQAQCNITLQKHNSEIHNIVLSSQSIALIDYMIQCG